MARNDGVWWLTARLFSQIRAMITDIRDWRELAVSGPSAMERPREKRTFADANRPAVFDPNSDDRGPLGHTCKRTIGGAAHWLLFDRCSLCEAAGVVAGGPFKAMAKPTDVFIGFDSAWTDNAKAPGAICATGIQDGRTVAWHPPRLAGFDAAREFIQAVRSPDGVTLIALDQPTLVPNAESMRPVERAVASVVSWLGGGVQAAHMGKIGMFCANSPVWPFLRAIGAVEDPEQARKATAGTFLMEVFPALALPSIDKSFAVRLGAPKYNPGNRRQYKRNRLASGSQRGGDGGRGSGLSGAGGLVPRSG